MPDTPEMLTMSTNHARPAPSSRTLTVHWEDPALGPQIAAQRGLSGLDYLRAIVRGELPPPPIARLMGLEIVHVEDGEVVFAATPSEQHYNPMGVVHGGLAATLLDSAIGCAMQTKAPPGAFYTTMDINVTYLRPLVANMGRVFGVARVLNTGRKTALAQGRVVNLDGKLFAYATSSCMLVPLERESQR